MSFWPLVFWRRWYNKHVDKIFHMVMPEGTWSLIDCNCGKNEVEERVEQEFLEFKSEMEIEEED